MGAGMTGDPCEACGTKYDRCTLRIINSHKPCCRTCGDTDTHNERVVKEVSLSVEAMAKVAALTKELNAVEQMETLRKLLLAACGAGYEGRTTEGLILELESRARDRTTEVRLLNQNLTEARKALDAARYEIKQLRAEREEWRERYNTERAQRQKVEEVLVKEGIRVDGGRLPPELRPDVVGMPSIPAEWQQVVSVEDDTAFFTRVVDGLYKNLWAGRGGQYYNDVELLQLTDVKRTK